jgi:hypothetical protein
MGAAPQADHHAFSQVFLSNDFRFMNMIAKTVSPKYAFIVAAKRGGDLAAFSANTQTYATSDKRPE